MKHRLMRARRGNSEESGFTLVEVLVVASTLALLAGILLNRILHYQELAEQVSVQQTISAIRTSLQLQALNLVAKGRAGEIADFANQNPMDWLAEKPPNYVGEVISNRKNSVVFGHWYFDSGEKKLVYLVHNGKRFWSESEPKQIVYAVRVLRGEAGPGGGKGVIEGVVLEQLNTFSWFK